MGESTARPSDATGATLEIWRSRTSRPLSADDALEITQNMTGFFSLLVEWATADKNPAVSSGEGATLSPGPSPSLPAVSRGGARPRTAKKTSPRRRAPRSNHGPSHADPAQDPP